MMNVEAIRADYQTWQEAGYPFEEDDALKALARHIPDLLAEVERLQPIEQAAREMREYVTVRDVMIQMGAVGNALDMVKRWDDALAAGQGK